MKKIFFVVCALTLSACTKPSTFSDSAPKEVPQQPLSSYSPAVESPSPTIEFRRETLQTPQQNPKNKEYYRINELGIEFKMPSDLDNLVYICTRARQCLLFNHSIN
jgi:hypothetical protein